jgi:hypothetical protein
MSEERTIFFAKSIQDNDRGNYIRTWKEKIMDTFPNSSIMDVSEVEKRIIEDGRNVGNVDSYKYGGEWRSWEDLYELEKKYYFPLIDKCDFVVAAEAWDHPRRGKYVCKTIVDMEYALGIGKKVFGINIEDWAIKEIVSNDLIKIKKEKEDEITFLKFLLRSL